jgi:hypothetical protein
VDNATETYWRTGSGELGARFVDGTERRQAGSSPKPFLYGLASRNAAHAGVLEDAPWDPVSGGLYRATTTETSGARDRSIALASSSTFRPSACSSSGEAFAAWLRRLG